jgi:hypothetical protein
MLITQSAYSSFVPRPFGSPRRSVIYGPRAFEGPRIGRSGSCRLASRWAHLLGSRGPALTTAQLIAIADNTTGG